MPSQIISDLQTLTSENRRGVETLFEAELELAELENKLDKAESQSFLKATGTIAEKQSIARYESADIRLERDIAKAKVSRIRMKLKVIESEIMANATISKLLQAEMKL